MKSVRVLLNYIKPYRWLAGKSIAYNILSAFFALFTYTLIIPFLQILFNRVGSVPEPGHFTLSAEWLKSYADWIFTVSIDRYGPVSTLLIVVVIFALSSLIKNLLVFLANNCMASLRSYTIRDIRKRIYEKILRLPLSFFSEARKGDLMTRVSNDVQEIEVSVVASLTMLFRDPVTIIVFLAYMLAKSPQLTLFALVLLPLSGWLISNVSRTLKGASFQGQQSLGRLLSVLEETLSGLRIVKGFNAEEKMKGQFKEANDHYTKILRRVLRKAYLSVPITEFLSTVTLLIILFYGAMLALKGVGAMAPEDLIGFVVVFSMIIQPAKAVSNAWFSIQKGMASMDRINQVLDAEETITEKPEALGVTDFIDRIEFRDVWFAYNSDEPVLKNISLTIKKGQTVAVVGRSGGGKSTLVDLLPRFIDPDRGAVLIDGKDIRDLKLKDLRQLMGIVSQQAILFNDTFSNNISFALSEARPEDIMRAAGIANAHDFIMDTSGGYDNTVGEGGNKLSGGQRQRVSIARAVMANPPILILDEATSALDTESERLVQDAMVKLMENRTSVIIAHRLSTIQHADLIVVVEDGCIVETGTHDQLLKISDGIYRKLYELQTF